jgi:uncharacterized SAM-binding protein YcdF (DUF218 family)
MSSARRLRTAVEAVLVVILVLLIDVGVSGYFLFAKAEEDPLQPADAIVVLGGEHDGREDYGITLAKQGWASTVVLSNPYLVPDGVMEGACRDTVGVAGPVEVLCPVPDPLTTRGEALMVRRLAEERSWTRLIVVTWRYHMPRARMIFRQCFSNADGALTLRAVPRRYHFSPLFWEYVFAYQWGGLAKAMLQGECSQAGGLPNG